MPFGSCGSCFLTQMRSHQKSSILGIRIGVGLIQKGIVDSRKILRWGRLGLARLNSIRIFVREDLIGPLISFANSWQKVAVLFCVSGRSVILEERRIV